jgi:hypothetical protein
MLASDWGELGARTLNELPLERECTSLPGAGTSAAAPGE